MVWYAAELMNYEYDGDNEYGDHIIDVMITIEMMNMTEIMIIVEMNIVTMMITRPVLRESVQS